MDDELWIEVYRKVERLDKTWSSPRRTTYSDGRIVEVYLWAVWHDRPVLWACRAEHWPVEQRGRPLPSPSRMSRRLRSDSVRKLLAELERRLGRTEPSSWVRWVDAKPLPVGGSTQDRQARYGRAAGGKAKGYKFYAICDSRQRLCGWEVQGMNVSEKVVCERLLRGLRQPGYLVGDGEYDSNRLYDLAGRKGIQLVAPKRQGRGLGHQYQSPYRLRSVDLQRGAFGQALLRSRAGVDRWFGQMGNFGGGLSPLPNWVRTLRRVRLWVQGKTILNYARLRIKRRRRVA
jgi:hypothetical protein